MVVTGRSLRGRPLTALGNLNRRAQKWCKAASVGRPHALTGVIPLERRAEQWICPIDAQVTFPVRIRGAVMRLEPASSPSEETATRCRDGGRVGRRNLGSGTESCSGRSATRKRVGTSWGSGAGGRSSKGPHLRPVLGHAPVQPIGGSADRLQGGVPEVEERSPAVPANCFRVWDGP